MGKNIEQTTTVTYTPEPDTSQYPPRQSIILTAHSEPGKLTRISVSVPTTGQRNGGWRSIDLRDADDLRALAEVAEEAYRDLIEGDDDAT